MTIPHLKGWEGTAAGTPRESWRDRAELAAHFIRPGDAVCDLGCGAQPLRKVLPESVSYLGVDCVSTLPGTHVTDFNAPGFTLPDAPFNVVTALGVLNYINDLDLFLLRLAELAPKRYFIFTYDFWEVTPKSGLVVNGMTSLDEAMALWSKYLDDVKPAITMRRRIMFTGTLGEGGAKAGVTQSATQIACRYIRPQEYLAVKLFSLDLCPRWLG